MNDNSEPKLDQPIELIPFELVIAQQKRLRSTLIGFVVGKTLVLLAFVALAIWQILAINNQAPPFPIWIKPLAWPALFFLALAFLICFLWIMHTGPRCPICLVRMSGGRELGTVLRTGRCFRCRTKLTTTASVGTKESESFEKRGIIRSGIYIVIAFGVVGPLGAFWLSAHQLLPNLNGPWDAIFALWILGFLLLSKIFLLTWIDQKRKKGAAEASKAAHVESEYPVLTVVQAKQHLVFRLYFSPSALCFGFVTNKVYLYSDTAMAAEKRGESLAMPSYRKVLDEKRRRELVYNTMNPESPHLLEIDPNNFQVPRGEIAELTYSSIYKWKLTQRRTTGGGGAGILTLTTHGKESRSFIVKDDLSKPEIDSIIQTWLANAQLEAS